MNQHVFVEVSATSIRSIGRCWVFVYHGRWFLWVVHLYPPPPTPPRDLYLRERIGAWFLTLLRGYSSIVHEQYFCSVQHFVCELESIGKAVSLSGQNKRSGGICQNHRVVNPRSVVVFLLLFAILVEQCRCSRNQMRV